MGQVVSGLEFRRSRSPKRGTREAMMSSGLLLTFLPLLVILAASCQHRPPELLQPVSVSSYSALINCTLSFRNHTTAFQGGCAVDPAKGVRVELRDVMGATKILLFLNGEKATAVVPESGAICAWSKATPAFPWGSSDLWAIFTGKLPSQRWSRKGQVIHSTWRNDMGKIRAELTSSADGMAERAFLKGPRGFRLEIKFRSVKGGAFPSEVFNLPRGVQSHRAPPAEVFSGVLP